MDLLLVVVVPLLLVLLPLLLMLVLGAASASAVATGSGLLLLPVLSLSRASLFIPFSVAASLSSSTSLFLSFCPFSASANDSHLFIPRLCIAREQARALLRLLTTAVPCRFCVRSLPFVRARSLLPALAPSNGWPGAIAKHQRRDSLLTNTVRCALDARGNSATASPVNAGSRFSRSILHAACG